MSLRKKIWIGLGGGVLMLILANLPFLPGPDFMYGISKTSYHLIMLISFLTMLGIPFVLVWFLYGLFKRRKFYGVAAALTFFPSLGLLNTRYIADGARYLSRLQSISAAENLISAIEEYRQDVGWYPTSIEVMYPDYIEEIPEPPAMGSNEYYYRLNGPTYEVSFHQSVTPFNWTVVVYNPMGTQEGEGDMRQLYETGVKNWKYYIFD